MPGRVIRSRVQQAPAVSTRARGLRARPEVHEFRVCREVSDASSAAHGYGVQFLTRDAAGHEVGTFAGQIRECSELELQDDQIVSVPMFHADEAEVSCRQIQLLGQVVLGIRQHGFDGSRATEAI